LKDQLGFLILIGAFGGLTGGLFGVGGSVVMIPALTETLGPDQHLYQAAAMIVNFFVAAPAAVQHYRMRAIQGAVVVRLIPLSMVAVVVGVGISELPIFAGRGEGYLRGLFGLFLGALSIQELGRIWRSGATLNTTGTLSDPNDPPAPPRTGPSPWRWAAAIAIPTGLIAGLLGVGGGLVAVPLQHRWLRVPMRTAIANSAAVIVATSFIGAAVKNYAFLQEHQGSMQAFALSVVLIPSAVLGSLVGSRWVHVLSLRLIKAAFFVLLFIGAARLVLGALG